MSTVSEIIESAFRESELTNELQSATPTQTTQALARLQNIVGSAYGFEVGEPLDDWPIGFEGVHNPRGIGWTQLQWERPRINVRMVAASITAQTVYLPANPYDGSRVGLVDPLSRLAAAPITLDAQGRSIEGAATFLANVDALQKIWFYRADKGNWTPITPLVYADDFPFPPEFDDYFITMLAMRLNPRYGRSITSDSAAALSRSMTMLQARYKQSENVGVDPALLVLAPQYNGTDARLSLYGSPDTLGNRGYGWGWMV